MKLGTVLPASRGDRTSENLKRLWGNGSKTPGGADFEDVQERKQKVQSRNSESDILNLSFKFQIAGRGAESGFWNARAGSWNLFNPLGSRGLADSHSQAFCMRCRSALVLLVAMQLLSTHFEFALDLT